MNHGSLFSGIGGFDYAAQLMGWTNRFHCEWNPFGQKVLKHYWPNAESYSDITKTDFSIWRGRIDILTGGFPCQPYSTAGKRLGKEDERHLWPEMLRAIREIQPRFVVGENVSGLVNWNGGMVFEEVQADLEAEGYEVRPFILPACAVNAPHRRDRIWFVAYSGCLGERPPKKSKRPSDYPSGCGGNEYHRIEDFGNERRTASNSPSDRRKRSREEIEAQEGLQPGPKSTGIMEGRPEGFCSEWTTSNTKSWREGGIRNQSEETRTRESDQSFGGFCGISHDDASYPNGIGLRRQSDRIGKSGFLGENEPGNYWSNFPTQSPICDGNDGISSRLDGITFSKWRNESIKAGGNAIVPQVALQIFKAIEEFEKINK